MHWSADYVGIPYKDRGYDRSGACCWGLLCLVEQEMFGIRLPRHDEPVAMVQAGQELMTSTFFAGARVVPVPKEEAREGDALHMRGFRGGKVTRMHCGVLVDKHHALHTEIVNGALVEDLRRAPWRWIQAYRFV